MQYLLCGLGLLCVAVWLKYTPGVIASIVLVLFQIPAVWPYYSGPVSHAAPCLTIGVANVYGANRHFDAFGDWLEESKPDVLLLQETEERWPTYLTLFADAYPYIESVTHPVWGFDAKILSRYPIAQHEVVALPPNDIPVQRAVLDVDGRHVALYNLHLFPTSQRRAMQNPVLRAALQRETLPYVVAGDFNATIWSPGQRDLMAGLNLRNAAFGFGYQPTWPARALPLLRFVQAIYLGGDRGAGRFSAPETITPLLAGALGIPLDHAYVSPEIGVTRYERGPGINSDHLPLLVGLSLPK